MKALTLKQPWAFLVCSGVKDIENRTWKCPGEYIGKRVLIHASGTTAKEPYMLFNDAQAQAIDNIIMDVIASYYTKSAIIGSVRIVDCVINHPSIWAEKTKMIIETPNDGCVSKCSEGVVSLSRTKVAKRFDDIEEARHILSIVKKIKRMEKSKIVIENIVYNWVLEDAILFDKPILNVKGKLGFWESNFEIHVCPICGSYYLDNNPNVEVPGRGNPTFDCKECGYMFRRIDFVSLFNEQI